MATDAEIKKIEVSFRKLKDALNTAESETIAAARAAGHHGPVVSEPPPDVTQLKQDIVNKAKEINTLHSQVASLKHELESTKRELQLAKAPSASLVASPRGQEIIATNLKKELEDLKMHHAATLNRHNTEVEELKKQIAELKGAGARRRSIETETKAKETVLASATPSSAYEFTNCGVTGRIGPSQTMVGFAYKTGAVKGVVSKAGIQVWKVPKTGQYRIKAFGSQGGSITSKSKLPGAGAIIQGDFDLTEGQELHILCGQEPKDVTITTAGGGGGTFVCVGDGDSKPLIVAGGGAGASSKHDVQECMHGSKETKGRTDFGGTEGRGGYATFGKTGGGGGGLKSNGTDGGGMGGKGFAQGGMGGEEDSKAPARNCSHGGFGGGGGGEFSETGSSGGGGGYSGGGPGGEDCGPAGGGGSFNSGKNQINLDGSEAYRGPGKVIIIPL